jgi:hypothetical protein
MNTLLETPAHEAEADNFCHKEAGVVRRAKGSSPNQGHSELRWLKANARMIGSRRDDLGLTHWKKVWRSMRDD